MASVVRAVRPGAVSQGVAVCETLPVRNLFGTRKFSRSLETPKNRATPLSFVVCADVCETQFTFGSIHHRCRRAVSDSSFKMPRYIPVVCGVCETRMTPPSKHAGRKIKCPDCETLCPIPTVEQLKVRYREELLSAPSQPEPHTPYDLQAPAETIEPTHRVFGALSSIRREEMPDPPKSLFLTTVFDFPWRSKGALIRWGLVSAGFSIVGMLAWFVFYMVGEFHFVGAIAAGGALLGVAIVGLISAGYAASCSFSILQETAAGVNAIEVWPEEGWKDGIFEFVLVMWLHASSGFFCYVFAMLVQPLTGYLSPPLLAMHVLLFPLALISAMDSDSVWLPYSTMAMKSLLRLPGIWALFYLLSGAFLSLTCGAFVVLAVKVPFAAGLALGPFVATVVFIYVRLLGRLAWKIGEDASREDDELLEL